MNHLGLNIKLLREKWGLSQEEFGFLIGATRGMIMQYERRGTMPKNATVSKIIKVTGLTKDILVNTELQDGDIPEISNIDYMTIERFRANPEDYQEADLTEDELKELSTIKKSKIESLTEALILEKDERRKDAELRAERAEKEKERLYTIIENNLTELLKTTGRLETNLLGAREDLNEIELSQRADHLKMLESMDRHLEKKTGKLVKESHTLKHAYRQEVDKAGKISKVGN